MPEKPPATPVRKKSSRTNMGLTHKTVTLMYEEGKTVEEAGVAERN